MTADYFKDFLADETRRAVEQGRRSIKEAQDRLAAAETALRRVEEDMPFFAGDLDLYGNCFTSVAKDCREAAVLIGLNARAQMVE